MKNICHNFYRKIIFNASALRLPVTGMEILTYSLCLLTEVPPGD